jgi:periplasmic divalent cation tolerance protein
MAEVDVCVVLVNTGSEEEAARIVRVVVEERLAACGNIYSRVRSIYRWQGAVEDEAEVPVILKTTRDRLSDLIARVEVLHSYDVPEIIALPVVEGHAPYLDWVRKNSR